MSRTNRLLLSLAVVFAAVPLFAQPSTGDLFAAMQFRAIDDQTIHFKLINLSETETIYYHGPKSNKVEMYVQVWVDSGWVFVRPEWWCSHGFVRYNVVPGGSLFVKTFTYPPGRYQFGLGCYSIHQDGSTNRRQIIWSDVVVVR